MLPFKDETDVPPFLTFIYRNLNNSLFDLDNRFTGRESKRIRNLSSFKDPCNIH